MFPLLLLLLSLIPPSNSLSGPHIADLNVLLPPRLTNPVEYRLKGSDGCFSWSWEHHDILSVLPEYNGTSRCSTSARLISIAPYSGRKETAVYAADLLSGTVIRCEVFIDTIFRIQIFHHSVKLDLHGLSTLHVRAFDEEENVFSSLVGLQFIWQLTPKSLEADGVLHHLVHIPLKDTPLSDCGGLCGDLTTQIKLENSGVGSDLYVVKGTEIGHEIVSVHLLEPQLEHFADEIVLTVVEAISLDPPSPVFVIIGASIHYTLRVIRQNTPQAIPLPSPYHRWSVSNTSVAQVDSTFGLVHALNLGITNVIVEDTRVAGHTQISSMHVVLPKKLSLYIIPVTISYEPLEGARASTSTVVWHVVRGRQYAIYLKVFSDGPDMHEIYFTESDDVKLQCNGSLYWDTFIIPSDIAVKEDWKIYQLIKATSQGLGNVTASLAYHTGNAERTEVIKVVQEVMVCEKIKISTVETNECSRPILLPWSPGISQEVELTATGGCGKMLKDYNWFSSDPAIVSVSAAGLVWANKPGLAIIKAVSVFDSSNFDEVIIEVSIPSSMAVLRNLPVETVVGTYLQAAVTMKASSGNYYCRCDAFSSFIRWQVLTGSEYFKIANTTEAWAFDMLPYHVGSKSLYGRPCAWASLYAANAGRALIQAALLKDLWQEMGTGLDILLLGGPEPWDHGVEFIDTVEIFTEDNELLKDGIVVDQAYTSRGTLYNCFCQKLGNFKLVFSRGNMVGDDHPLPAIADAEVSVICSLPSSITLIANEPVNRPDLILSATQADRGPGKLRISPITVANACTIRVSAVGIHSSGNAFANASSLCLKWELSHCDDLAYWEENGSLERSMSTWERFLVLQNKTGQCTVRATVAGFAAENTSGHYPENVSLQLESLDRVLTDAINLQLVSSLRIAPEFILLFFYPNAKANLSVIGGTCSLDAAVNDTEVVEVIQSPTSLQCFTLTLGIRGLGSALVTAVDIGLAVPIVASALVQVADVDWIKIVSPEEIWLVGGATQSMEILAGIHDGTTFDLSQYLYMNIHVHLEDGVLELVDNDGFSRLSGGEIHGPKFLIRAAQLGVTTFHVHARRHSGHEILSQRIKVEVYAPLRIYPQDVFLAPGASYVLTVRGGPTTGAVIEYASMDDLTARIHRSTGRLSAISLGNTTVHATAYGNGGTIICEAYGRVKVGIPSAMVINLQSKQLGVGCEMPIHLSSAEGNLFSFYELCKHYRWTIEDEQILSFKMSGSLHSNDMHGIQSNAMEKYPEYSEMKDLDFINVLYGRSAGRTTVAVSFSCDFVSAGSFSRTVSYEASESLSVFSDPPLALGVPMTWLLPPFYTTSNILPSSSESYGEWDSRGQKGNVIYSVLRTCGGNNEFPKQDGVAIDGGRVKTKESNSLACIQAKDRVTGRAAIASCVRVAEVAQVRVTTTEFPSHFADLAVGAKLKLVIKYTDALGNPFYEASDVVPFDVETNYPDVVSIQTLKEENKTRDCHGIFYIQAIRRGRALVQISINDSALKAVYLLISVGAHISPQNPVLHVGHHLNLSIIGEGNNDLSSGKWFSGNESVISVNELYGEAHAVGEGSTYVSFESLSLKLQTTVTVLAVDQILVDAPADTLTNVPFPVKGYRFIVRFSGAHNNFEATRNGIRVLYDCRVDPSFVGHTKPWRDLNNGNLYCLFFPHSPEHLMRSLPKLNTIGEKFKSGGSDGLSISMIASLRQAQQVVGSADSLFVGGFSILGTGKLNLTSASNRSVITIVGNTDVEIHWNAKRFSLVVLKKDDFGISGRAEYEVKVINDESFAEKIIITLPATGQTEEVEVSYVPGERSASAMASGIIWVAILACTAILLLTVVFFTRLLDRPDRSRQPVPVTSVGVGNITPDRSPSENTLLSPRTPQPYVDYVKRTIDETPYYRRGRRRFDPQHTY
ncbi:hypothetical protein MRB53_031361 [Persea americana]|uniref:Uncharacterized protein n=1 Tax=Persea americana TaxID=3435 RepID=A0ACC2KPX8_PERAE|nr:hypothetical protein MRB53_031361 [Persea americana]